MALLTVPKINRLHNTYLDGTIIAGPGASFSGTFDASDANFTGLNITNPIVVGGTITNTTINNSTINNSTINNGTANNLTLVNPTITGGTSTGTTINNAIINGGTSTGTTINNPTINGGTSTGTTIVNATITGGTSTNTTLNTPIINNASMTGGTSTNMTLNTPTINAPNMDGGGWNNAVLDGATFFGSIIFSPNTEITGLVKYQPEIVSVSFSQPLEDPQSIRVAFSYIGPSDGPDWVLFRVSGGLEAEASFTANFRWINLVPLALRPPGNVSISCPTEFVRDLDESGPSSNVRFYASKAIVETADGSLVVAGTYEVGETVNMNVGWTFMYPMNFT